MKVLYLIDHVYSDLALDQKCCIHDKEWLSQHFEILYIVRTLRPTFVKYRANYKIIAFNHQEPFEVLMKEIEQFGPQVMHLIGPFHLGNAASFVEQLYGKCKIVQQYGGSHPSFYWNEKIDYFLLEQVLEPAFSHIPKDRLILRNNCCDLDFFRPIEMRKQYDCIMTAGFYCSKGQDVVYHSLQNDPVSVMFIGEQKSNMGEWSSEFLALKNQVRPEHKIKATFQEFVPPTLMPFFYNQAKMFVWGSKHPIENPITIINRSVTEAVACGLPFVGFEETYRHSNFVIHGENAILVKTEEEFRNAVIQISSDDELRLRLGQASRRIAKARLDSRIWHDQLLKNLYEKMINTK